MFLPGESQVANASVAAVASNSAGAAGSYKNKKINNHFKSFRLFLRKHSNDSVDALPAKKWSAMKTSTQKMFLNDNNVKIYYNELAKIYYNGQKNDDAFIVTVTTLQSFIHSISNFTN